MLFSAGIAVLSILGLAHAQVSNPSATTFDRRGPGIRVQADTGPLGQFTGGKVSWRFNGDISTWGDGAGLAYVPMIKDYAAIDKVTEAAKSWGPDVTHVMAFDATNNTDDFQPMSDEESVVQWERLRAALDSKYKLGIPLLVKFDSRAGTSVGEASAQFWMDFCEVCDHDFIPIEFAGSDLDELSSLLVGVSYSGGPGWSPIWITKVGPDPRSARAEIWRYQLTCLNIAGNECDEAESIEFLQKFQSWLETDYMGPAVERYVWDGAVPGEALLAQDGSLTALGKLYVGA